MNVEILAAIALFVLIFGAFSQRLEKSVITPPMAYVTFGLLISPAALGFTQGLTVSNEVIKSLAEATLAVVLFKASRPLTRLTGSPLAADKLCLVWL
ncbi:MAG: hypothetical protein WBB01_24100 [Phormidesmis sp.]